MFPSQVWMGGSVERSLVKTFFFALLFTMVLAARAKEIRVQVLWDANQESDLAGYRIYWGTAPNRLSNSCDVGYKTSHWINGLDDQVSYYIAITAVDFWGNESALSKKVVVASENGNALPAEFALSPNFPNPCKPVTRFDLQLPAEKRVRLAVFNLLGERVRQIEDALLPAGQYRYQWQGDDESGAPVPAGTYFLHLESDGRQIVRRLVLIR